VPVREARERLLRCDLSAVLARVIRASTLTAALLIAASSNLQTAVADGDTRTLSFRNAHTGEEITVTFKRNGRYDAAALKQLNWFMRDWRKEQQVEMDPQLFDLVWEANRAVGGTQAIEVICGYRSPETNAMLRARSNAVAENSNHTRGLALDFFIPGVPLEKIREVGLRLQRGGVGFYPSSGSPFVHLDTGSIRHWPRMTYDQLARVFPDGRTVHLPSNGQPLPGYELALADAERQGRSPSAFTLAAARNVTTTHDSEDQSAPSYQPGLIETLLGFKKDPPAPVTAPAQPTLVASVAPKPAAAAIPVPKHRPARDIEIATYVPTPAARPSAAGAIVVALAEPVITASAGQALAYAAVAPVPAAVVSAVKPMGAVPKVTPAPATAKLAAAPTRVADAHAILGLGEDPWLRATMLAPNASRFLTATATGKYETREFAEFVKKPTSAVVMSFSAMPYAELSTDRFSGNAVVFVATATFGTRTAALVGLY
jgi:uncharacterized protein YcbK (DUF882 family)